MTPAPTSVFAAPTRQNFKNLLSKNAEMSFFKTCYLQKTAGASLRTSPV